MVTNLSDRQLRMIMQAAEPLPIEKRDVFLRRIGAELQRCGRFTDDDVIAVARRALHGLIQQQPAA